jgi:hypothetical protein
MYTNSLISVSGDDLIKLLNECNKLSRKQLLISKKYSTIKKAVLRAVTKDYKMVKCIIPYPISIFQCNETAATGVHLDILQVAAEILLRFKPEDVALKPTKSYNDLHQRLYTDMTSGKAYEAHYHRIQKQFGKNVYPLCICISGDEVQINKKGSMACKPWYISIANIRGELNMNSNNIETIGYSPDFVHTKVCL